MIAVDRFERALGDASARDPEARWQRDVAVRTWSAQVMRLRGADNGLCFGRLDGHAGERRYIGRIGLLGDDLDDAPLLVDWRAPVARPFYCATAANPEGVARRRQLHTRSRDILGFHDEVLDMGNLDTVNGERDTDSALLAAVNAPRTDSMRDIVATIQAEQDEIIRLGSGGVLVIQGAPGTGKTAVALHRVAYLLYTQRERLSRRAVLVIGPNAGFLSYIGDVLPSLGETDVVFATLGELLPGLSVTATDWPDTQRVKGVATMVDVLVAAVADRQELPTAPIAIDLSDVTVRLDRRVAESARDCARATGLPHNEAREVFQDAVIASLTERAVRLIGTGWLRVGGEDEVAEDLAADVRAELDASSALRAAVDGLWPSLTPQRLLAELFASWDRLAVAASSLPAADRDALFRARGDEWTVSDIPLLDEAIDLLGPEIPADRSAERERSAANDYARGVLQILDTEEDPAGELLRAVDLVDAAALSDRHAERDHRLLAERAAADRDWTYGHVVVDEAQELSEMDWRAVMRRCPSRSMTVVGDLAQRQSAAGARSWADMLDSYVPGRWTYRELTVNYRTPAEIMAVAADVLAEADPAMSPPESVRRNGIAPWSRRVDAADLPIAVAVAVEGELGRVGDGSVAVIAPHGLTLDVSAPVFTPYGAKGLEFDAVLIVEPQRILADGPRGAAELYVALTRATQRLGVLHTEPLPVSLCALVELAPAAQPAG
ncbi:AAA family ATPase [Solihabitans fulvus]|uniref:AAA family ATPase n=1 Tax=Solihabitans fulvus TaxID=1892852 RepID=A0A5B2WNI8_9PSEU|nr:AAA family ATPase [Solihabitans fulvus]KAA2252548.1 AAA family ATPase [Solihabitans fulvus]